jgi:hypothetical protein
VTRKTYTAIEPGGIAKWVVVWLWIHIGAAALQLITSVYQLTEYAGLDPSSSGTETFAGDLPAGLSLIGYFLVYVATGFVALKWMYRVSRNAHAFAQGLGVSPPWTVGWNFVPVASLWKPFQAMSEIWQASERPKGWRNVKTPPLLIAWWVVWIIASVVENISGRFLSQETIGDRQVSSYLDAFAAVLIIPADLLFMQVVQRLTRMQTHQITFGEVAPETEAVTVAAPA